MLSTFDAGHGTQKTDYQGELLPTGVTADPQGTLFRDIFQRDRVGKRKDISVIDSENFVG